MNQKVGLAVPGEPQSGATDPWRTLGGGGSERRFVGALGQTRPTDALVHGPDACATRMEATHEPEGRVSARCLGFASSRRAGTDVPYPHKVPDRTVRKANGRSRMRHLARLLAGLRVVVRSRPEFESPS